MGAGAWVLQSSVELSGDSPAGAEALVPLRALAREAQRCGADRFLLGAVVAERVVLDGFELAAALAEATLEPDAPAIGTLCWLGEGRAASVAMRELTCVDHLHPGRAALLFAGGTQRLAEAGAVARALVHGEPASAGGPLEHVTAAPNLPAPPESLVERIALYDAELGAARTLGGTPLTITHVRELDEITELRDGELVVVGSLAR